MRETKIPGFFSIFSPNFLRSSFLGERKVEKISQLTGLKNLSGWRKNFFSIFLEVQINTWKKPDTQEKQINYLCVKNLGGRETC